MMQAIEVQQSLFNYAALDTETRIVVQQRTSEIKTLMRRSAQDIIDIGQKLIEVKGRLGHGHFGGWLESEFSWTPMTAQRFMQVAERFKNNNLLDFNIAPSALYALAAPSTPEPARIEAVSRAQSGEIITHSAAKTIINGHKPAKVAYVENDDTARIAAIRKVIAGQPDAESVIIDDLKEGRRGWYHEAILCYCDDTTPEEWQRIALKYFRELTANTPAAVTPVTSTSDVRFVQGEPKPYPPGDILPSGHAAEYSPVRLAVTPVAQRPLTVTECEAAIARYLERHGQPDDPAMQRVLLDGLDIKDMTPVIREDRTITHDTFKNARRRIADELDRQIHAARKVAEIDRSQRTLRLSYAQVRALYAYLLIKGLGPNEGDERVGRAMDPSPEDFEAAFEAIRRAALYAPEVSV